MYYPHPMATVFEIVDETVRIKLMIPSQMHAKI